MLGQVHHIDFKQNEEIISTSNLVDHHASIIQFKKNHTNSFIGFVCCMDWAMLLIRTTSRE